MFSADSRRLRSLGDDLGSSSSASWRGAGRARIVAAKSLVGEGREGHGSFADSPEAQKQVPDRLGRRPKPDGRGPDAIGGRESRGGDQWGEEFGEDHHRPEVDRQRLASAGFDISQEAVEEGVGNEEQ